MVTRIDWTRATAFEPIAFSPVITRMSRMPSTFAQNGSSCATTELA